MSDDTTAQCVLFPDLFRRPVVTKFDQLHASCDGGAILLNACDEALGLTERLATCIVDGRQADKVEHSIRHLARQRLYGIACGYADCNDAERLSEDPIQQGTHPGTVGWRICRTCAAELSRGNRC